MNSGLYYVFSCMFISTHHANAAISQLCYLSAYTWTYPNFALVSRHYRCYMGIMELYERHGVSNQYQLDYLFNRLFILTALETKRARIAGPLCLCADRGGFPAQIDSSVESISKAWRHYEKRNE